MSIAALAPALFPQYLDENTLPYSGGSLTYSQSGNDTPKNVYADNALTISIGNVITLNTAGRPTSNGTVLTHIFFAFGSYRVKLKDSDGNTIWTVDGVTDLAYLATLTILPDVQITFVTGTQNDFVLEGDSYATQVLRCYNASDVTFSGFAPTALTDGQRLTVLAMGAGNVNLVHNATSSPSYRLTNLLTATNTYLVGGSGCAEFVYDGSANRWKMVSYGMGGFKIYTSTWTAAVGTPAIGDGTLTGRYSVVGRSVTVSLILTVGSTTTFGTGAWQFTLPMAAEDQNTGQVGNAMITDAGTGLFRYTPIMIDFTHIALHAGDGTNNYAGSALPMTWAAGDYFVTSFTYSSS